MRRLGLIGGSSWVSTIEYYRFINEMVNERLGGMEFARLSLDSINFGELIRNNEAEDWAATDRMLIACAQRLKASAAQGLVICANTLHLHAKSIQDAVDLPVIHIGAATASAIKKRGLSRVALLGTKWTMEWDVYTSILAQEEIDVLIPNDADRALIHSSIFDELGKGIFAPSTKGRYLSIIEALTSKGAEGVILGCTEIPLLLPEADVPVPSFDTTKLHAAAAVDFYLGNS